LGERSARIEDRPLRILHITPYCADAWAYGGIPRLVGALTRGLARQGHQVTLCATDACDAASRLHNREAASKSDGVEVRIFPNLSNHLAYHLQLFLPIGLNQYLSEHAGDFDVAHIHACRNIPGAIASFHLQRAGVPYVLAPNGTAPRIERRLLAKRLYDVVLGRRVLERAVRVLAVSPTERAQLLALGIDASVIRLVPNPVDLDEFAAPLERGRFRRRLGVSDDDSVRVVMFLGKLTPRKRVDVLVRAFAQVKRTGAVLVIAGNDMGSGKQVRGLVSSLGLNARTFITGLLRGHERLEALADADVLVYPSEAEIFGLVPLEALLAGTPVIVADDSGCGEIISRIGGGEVVAHGNVDALTGAIERTLERRSPLAVEAAADRIRAAYGAEVVCTALESVYRDMVAA
jgi:glycosyltransferase involved in cell wall biosynthesis